MQQEFLQELNNTFGQNNITLTTQQQTAFYNYYCMLIDWNKKFNLTAITEMRDVVVKHFLDSVVSYSLLPKGANIIDIGAGAGFPSLPLKILRPDLKITLIDSVNKKITFLNEVILNLKLENVIAIHGRVEDLAVKSEHREQFDFCLSRAVAQLNTLAEYSLPFVKVGGSMLSYKSNDIDEELKQSEKAIALLGGKIDEVKNLKVDDYFRKIVIIKKIKNCPNKYPRGKNKPRLEPLM